MVGLLVQLEKGLVGPDDVAELHNFGAAGVCLPTYRLKGTINNEN